MKTLEQLAFDNTYARLPARFYSRVTPTPQGTPYRVSVNPAAAALLGLDPQEFERPDFPAIAAGYQPLPQAEPIAAVYAGHQFGVYVPRLGDGRAILLGEVMNGDNRWEIQLKGAGPTPYSRMGDGYAVLRSTIREYLAGEAMHGLGIPTTRALAIVGSDAPVYRETAETGATLIRLAPTYVRFGTFEFFSHTQQTEALKTLADYVIERHYPEFSGDYAGFFREVVTRTARLLAQWQAVGFTHGVMNTDNMSIVGLTIDYGPYGFMDAYIPRYIPNHSDAAGRYAFSRQPQIALWNLAALGQALLPLCDEAALRAALDSYGEVFNAHYLALMCAKLGLGATRADDAKLIEDFLILLARNGSDYTNSFRALSRFSRHGDNTHLRDRFLDRPAFAAWAGRYAERLAAEASDDGERQVRMNRVNPKYILRNYLAQLAIERAQHKDFDEIERLRQVLADPYSEQPDFESYAAAPPDWAREIELSCSS